MAAMLDELMGRHRNANPDEKVAELTWEDDQNCKYFLVDFCPHELFTNTKADLGICHNIHDDEMKKQFDAAKENSRKLAAEDEFLRFCQKMLNDVGLKIKRSKDRLQADRLEQDAARGITPSAQAENAEKIEVLTDKINVLVDQAEKAGCEGDVDEAQSLLKVCDELKVERDELQKKIGAANNAFVDPYDKYGTGAKGKEVCEICGSFLVIGAPDAKLDIATANKIKKWQDDHLMGKMHVGYARLKASVEKILEARKERRELREKEREERKNRGGDERKRSRSRGRSSRDRRSRSRSRDRRRSRSRDRRRRSRSRSRDRRRRSRSRSRDRRRR